MKYIAQAIFISVGFACGLFQIWLWLMVPAAAAFICVYLLLCVINRRVRLPDEDAWYVFFMLAILLGAGLSIFFPELAEPDSIITAHGTGMKIGGALLAIFGGLVALVSYPHPGLTRHILEEAITNDTFFIEEPHLHDEESDYIFPPGVSDDEIAETEKRLRILLPVRLSDLYKRQNGGFVPHFCYEGDAGNLRDPFPSDTLAPLSALETLAQYLDHAYADSETKAQLSTGDANMIVLDAIDGDVLVLNANEKPEVEVGHLQLDIDTGAIVDAVWWPSFDAFLASLRRYIYV